MRKICGGNALLVHGGLCYIRQAFLVARPGAVDNQSTTRGLASKL